MLPTYPAPNVLSKFHLKGKIVTTIKSRIFSLFIKLSKRVFLGSGIAAAEDGGFINAGPIQQRFASHCIE
jgi:hypothetical protein